MVETLIKDSNIGIEEKTDPIDKIVRKVNALSDGQRSLFLVNLGKASKFLPTKEDLLDIERNEDVQERVRLNNFYEIVADSFARHIDLSFERNQEGSLVSTLRQDFLELIKGQPRETIKEALHKIKEKPFFLK